MCYILCGLIVLVIEAHLCDRAHFVIEARVLYPMWVDCLGDETSLLYPVWVDQLGDRSSCDISCVGW